MEAAILPHLTTPVSVREPLTKGIAMKAAQIKVGGTYHARVSGNYVTVRVDGIRERFDYENRSRTVYDVTNLKTGRKLVFQSAMKFRSAVTVSKLDEVVRPEATADRLLQEERAAVIEEMPDGGKVEGEQCSDPTTVGTSAKIATEPEMTQTAAGAEPVATTDGSKCNGLSTKIAQHISTVRQLTDEQQAIVAAAPTTQVLVIEAGAGCGKTSTLVELAKAMPGIGQYTAFNASLVAESKTKFPRNVQCNTIHSLAFRSEGVKHQHRLGGRRTTSSEVAAMLGLRDMTIEGADGKPKVLNAGLLASQVTRAIRTFCQSAHRELTVGHLPRLVGIDAEHSTANSDAVKEHLLPFAQKMWVDKCDPKGTLPFTHDDYVKMWEMNDPTIGADYVLLDEAQDTSPVMLSIMEQQVRKEARVILVGDSAQQIYSWRGAVNALAAFPDAPRLMLSQSFRFGQVVAEVANATLSHLTKPTPLVMHGFDQIQSRLDSVSNPTTILCRTNAGAVSHLIDGIARSKHPFLIGGGDDVAAFVRAAGDLQRSKSTNHPELCCFSNWCEVQAYAKTEDGEDLRLMVKLIDQFTVNRLLAAIGGMPDEKDADLVISTAHKSKGREWSAVKLASDFKPLDKMGDEEVRLLYVAATRAQHILDVETCPPFCGGQKRADEGWNGEGGELRTVDISEARRLSNRVPKPQAPQPTEQPKPTEDKRTNGGNTWAKGRSGDWLVRGKVGQTGEVEVVSKKGEAKRVTIKRVVWKNENVALYEVA